jgi:hypothetical protein
LPSLLVARRWGVRAVRRVAAAAAAVRVAVRTEADRGRNVAVPLAGHAAGLFFVPALPYQALKLVSRRQMGLRVGFGLFARHHEREALRRVERFLSGKARRFVLRVSRGGHHEVEPRLGREAVRVARAAVGLDPVGLDPVGLGWPPQEVVPRCRRRRWLPLAGVRRVGGAR